MTRPRYPSDDLPRDDRQSGRRPVVSITIHVELLAQIDRARGSIPRSTWIAAVLAREVGYDPAGEAHRPPGAPADP